MIKNSFTTKIIAGEYKGKKLKLPNIQITRSSKSIVKESLFNYIGFDIINSTFVELFGGSGSIGLEALSRGAKKIYFFEKNSYAIEILKHNIKSLNHNKCEVIAGDIFDSFSLFLKHLKQKNNKIYFYADPPFHIRDGMSEIYDKTLQLLATIPENIVELLVIEHMTGIKLLKNIGKLQEVKSKKFGKTTLTYYKKILIT